MYIYEIGSITYFAKNDELEKVSQWRDTLDDWANDKINTFNPVKTYLRERNHSYCNKMIVDQNEYYINKCDIAVANLDKIDYSPGSIYELARFKMQGKPVIAIGEKHWSPHIDSCISQYCKDINEVLDLLDNMFDQNYYSYGC